MRLRAEPGAEAATTVTPFPGGNGVTGDAEIGENERCPWHEKASSVAERATFVAQKGVTGDAPTLEEPRKNLGGNQKRAPLRVPDSIAMRLSAKDGETKR